MTASQNEMQHLTDEEIAGLLDNRLDFRRAEAAGAHVRFCAECAALVDSAFSVSAHSLADRATASEEHLDFDADVVPYVEGRLDAADVHRINEHLSDCGICARDVADLVAFRPMAAPPRRRRWLLPVAASLLALLALWAIALSLRTERSQSPMPVIARENAPATPVVTTPAEQILRDGAYEIRIAGDRIEPSYGNDSWNELARRAIADRRVSVAPLDDLRGESEVLRGGETPVAGGIVAPAGVVVMSDQPELRWRGPANARYDVTIARGDDVVARGEGIRGSSWTPAKPLARGETYVWQLTIRDGGSSSIVPSPTDPPALFRVLDAAIADEIARAKNSGAHLIAALLLARAGATNEAREQLALVGDRALAGDLAKSLHDGSPTSTNADQ